MLWWVQLHQGLPLPYCQYVLRLLELLPQQRSTAGIGAVDSLAEVVVAEGFEGNVKTTSWSE